MRTLLLILILIATITPARAQTFGRVLTHDDVYATAVRGFHLNMTQDEATAILKRDHWEGEWHEFTDSNKEFPFSKDNSKLYLMRYYDNEHVMRLWSIVDRQTFNRPDFGEVPINRAISDIWIDTVVRDYGEPSIEFSNPNGINAYVYYLMANYNVHMPKLETYLNGHEASYELSDITLLKEPPRW